MDFPRHADGLRGARGEVGSAARAIAVAVGHLQVDRVTASPRRTDPRRPIADRFLVRARRAIGPRLRN